MKQYKKGFTLIELLVVIAIIGILSTMAVVSLGSARTKARDSKRLADIRSVQTAVEIYYTDQGVYPGAAATNGCPIATTIEGCCLNDVSGGEGGWKTAPNCTVGSTLITVPLDPRNTQTWDNYIYSTTGTPANQYYVQFGLELDPDGAAVGMQATTTAITTNCLSNGGMTAEVGGNSCP